MIDEVQGVGFHNPGDKFELSWIDQYRGWPDPIDRMYQVMESPFATFPFPCTVLYLGSGTEVDVSGLIGPGRIRYYLVRATQPNIESWGQNSTGAERNSCVP